MKNKNQQSEQQIKTSRTQRRILLGAISGAGVVGAAKLPGQWTRPVVDHVLLPAHASTTDDVGSSPTGGTTGTFITTVTSNCVVTCTTAYSAYLYVTAPYSASYMVVFGTGMRNYGQCVDGQGATASSASETWTLPSTTFSSTDIRPSLVMLNPQGTYTSSGMCYVTVTSS